MAKLHKSGNFGSFDYESYDTLESFLLGKMTKFLFKGKGERASGPLDLIHTNVCGPMSTHTKGGFIYFITFNDEFSRYWCLYLMKYTSKAFENFKELELKWRNNLGEVLKHLDLIKVVNA